MLQNAPLRLVPFWNDVSVHNALGQKKLFSIVLYGAHYLLQRADIAYGLMVHGCFVFWLFWRRVA